MDIIKIEDAIMQSWLDFDARTGRELAHRGMAEIAAKAVAAISPAQEWQDISTAVAAEREACAKLAGNTALAWDNTLGGRLIGEEVSKAIRARGALIAEERGK